MENNNANLPAFPPNAGWEHSEARGLSKREYIAAMAIQGMLASRAREGSYSFTFLNTQAIEQADDLLKQLEETKQP